MTFVEGVPPSKHFRCITQLYVLRSPITQPNIPEEQVAYRGYADTPILRACAAYAAILGGKSARVARLSAMERRVFPMASHVGSTPSTTGNWVCMARVHNENLGSLGTQMILTRLIPCRYSPADVHGSMPHLSQPCMYSARIFLIDQHS